MRNFTRSFLVFICCVALLLPYKGSCGGHISGANLTYTHISGSTYKVTLALYGECAPASAAAFRTLQISTP